MSERKGSEALLPVVEIFESLEGEGTRAGYPTTFIRLFGCNLRCRWCDTQISYPPAAPARWMTVADIVRQVEQYHNQHLCLTGGEPLLHGEMSVVLLRKLAGLKDVVDLHVETNGSVDLAPFEQLRISDVGLQAKLRFIMDYKLPGSEQTAQMKLQNFQLLQDQDEIKFVVANEADFFAAVEILQTWYYKGQPLFSPVWESISFEKLAALILQNRLKNVRFNLQLHKVIWGMKQGV